MFGEVPRILATLPRWAAIEIAWNRKYVDLFSPVASAILDPISVISEYFCEQEDGKVSVSTMVYINFTSMFDITLPPLYH